MKNLVSRHNRLPLFGIIFASVLLAAFLVHTPKASAFYSNGVGDGSLGAPYHVLTCTQLGLINTDEGAHYVMDNDIDCSTGWAQMIGDLSITSGFTGSFDGQGYTISNLDLDMAGQDDVGLFSEITGSAEVKNLVVMGNVNAKRNVGLLTARITGNAHVENVATYGSIVCEENCGGIAGFMNTNSSLSRSYSVASITGSSGMSYGGLVGWTDGSGTVNIADSYYRGTLDAGSGAIYVGGLVGYATKMAMYNSYATGSVSGDLYVGGLVGFMFGITNSITDSFAANTVTGTLIGPVIGDNVGSTLTDVYYDQDISGGMSPNGSEIPISGDPDYFLENSTNPPFDNWLFSSTIWRTNRNDYPSLKPLLDPFMLCEAPQSTNTTIYGICGLGVAGWGDTTWEARYQKQGDSSWTDLTLNDPYLAEATVTGLIPGTWYHLQFRYTNDFGTGQWGTLQILTTGTAPEISTTPEPAPTATKKKFSLYKDPVAEADSDEPTLQPVVTPTTFANLTSLPLQTAVSQQTARGAFRFDARNIILITAFIIALILLIRYISTRILPRA